HATVDLSGVIPGHHAGGEVVRTWTITSSPPAVMGGPDGEGDGGVTYESTDAIEITVKRKEGGLVSTFLHSLDAARPPEVVVQVLGVGGDFTLPAFGFDGSGRRRGLLFLAGGVGITPVLGMLAGAREAALSSSASGLPHATPDVKVIWSVSTADDVSLSLLERMRAAGAEVVVVVSKPTAADVVKGNYAGRLTKEIMVEAAADARDRSVMICGPSGYLSSAQKIMAALGVEDVVTESFAY
ncbi:hypothetical protein HK101_005957, partial [Irineochytrium annulatum]